MKEKYALSMLHLKNTEAETFQEKMVTHFWYFWPETGVPTEETSIIAMLLEARSYLQSSEQSERLKSINNNQNGESGAQDTSPSNNKSEKSRSLQRSQG